MWILYYAICTTPPPPQKNTTLFVFSLNRWTKHKPRSFSISYVLSSTPLTIRRYSNNELQLCLLLGYMSVANNRDCSFMWFRYLWKTQATQESIRNLNNLNHKPGNPNHFPYTETLDRNSTPKYEIQHL